MTTTEPDTARDPGWPAVVLMLAATVTACSKDSAPASRRPTAIAVYADDGAWAPSTRSTARALEADGLSVSLLDAADIRAGGLEGSGRAREAIALGGTAWPGRRADRARVVARGRALDVASLVGWDCARAGPTVGALARAPAASTLLP